MELNGRGTICIVRNKVDTKNPQGFLLVESNEIVNHKIFHLF